MDGKIPPPNWSLNPWGDLNDEPGGPEIAQLRTMLAASPESLELKEWLAFKTYLAGLADEAEILLRDLIGRGHRVGVQAFYLGNLLAKANRPDEAVEFWRLTVAEIPTDAKAKKAAARIARVLASQSGR